MAETRAQRDERRQDAAEERRQDAADDRRQDAADQKAEAAALKGAPTETDAAASAPRPKSAARRAAEAPTTVPVRIATAIRALRSEGVIGYRDLGHAVQVELPDGVSYTFANDRLA